MVGEVWEVVFQEERTVMEVSLEVVEAVLLGIAAEEKTERVMRIVTGEWGGEDSITRVLQVEHEVIWVLVLVLVSVENMVVAEE